jgi:hypothetical protein
LAAATCAAAAALSARDNARCGLESAAPSTCVDFSSFTGGSYFLNGSRPPFSPHRRFGVFLGAERQQLRNRQPCAMHKLNRIVRSYFIQFFLIRSSRCLLALSGRRGLRAGGGEAWPASEASRSKHSKRQIEARFESLVRELLVQLLDF